MPVRRPRLSFALAAAVATAAAFGATALATTTASAAEVPLSGYELTWGIKQSYRTYVTGVALGSFTAADGASQAADNGAFTFTDGTGTYDTTGHTLHLTFKGTVTAKSTLHGFVREMSDFQYDSAAGTLTADLVSNGGTKQQDVTLATVAAPTSQDLKNLATTLTAAAGTFLGSDSYANAAGDPLSAAKPTSTTSPTPSNSSTESASASPTPTPTPTGTATPSTPPSTTPSDSASPSDTASEPAATKGDIADGKLNWGVKESFRSYVVGSVANGRITTSAGASQAAGNGVFTFTGATGTYDTDADTLSAAFEGAVNFKGHEDNGTYGLDLTFTDLKATLDNGSGKLTADVTSLGEKSEDVVLADLKSDSTDLTAKNDVITLDDVTTTLTAAGAKAFGGFYQTGAALDPLDLSVALTADADLPSDNSSSTTGTSSSDTSANSGTTGSTSGGVTGSTTGGVNDSLASTGSDIPVAALGTAAAVTVAAGAGVVFAVRRRRTEA
ncbi:HtaA domain-containing protein [Streptomyces sp. NPDC050508]|uniref:HtaA domain-containing protein n=1 Tax=Streptomyces sp. NPDC050508 TaxID=3155405 RepID=UPI00343E8705